MATVKQIIEQAYTKVNGEYESITESSDDFKTYLTVLNQSLESWANTPYVHWQSLFNMNYQLPDTVVADTLVYAVPNADEIDIANSPLDNIFFVDGTGMIMAKFKMVDQALFQSTTVQTVACLTNDGLHLKSTPQDIIGTTIVLPVYMLPPKYTLGGEEVRVDSVPWLISYMAATICDASPVPFIARNADKYYKQAETFMKKMKDANRRSQILSVKGASNRTIASLSQAIEAGIGVGGGSFTNIDGGNF